MNEHIAYMGLRFTIEWYFDDTGHSPALEYFNNLEAFRKEKALYLFSIMGNFGKISNDQKFISEGDQIYAFKPAPDRFLCFFVVGSKIIITNAFEKKTQKIPPREKIRAIKYMNNYLERIKNEKKNIKKSTKHVR